MLNNVRMLVGKGGRLFDPNPAAGSGEKDFECCFCDKGECRPRLFFFMGDAFREEEGRGEGRRGEERRECMRFVFF